MEFGGRWCDLHLAPHHLDCNSLWHQARTPFGPEHIPQPNGLRWPPNIIIIILITSITCIPSDLVEFTPIVTLLPWKPPVYWKLHTLTFPLGRGRNMSLSSAVHSEEVILEALELGLSPWRLSITEIAGIRRSPTVALKTCFVPNHPQMYQLESRSLTN